VDFSTDWEATTLPRSPIFVLTDFSPVERKGVRHVAAALADPSRVARAFPASSPSWQMMSPDLISVGLADFVEGQ
jgi:hypothetical protein